MNYRAMLYKYSLPILDCVMEWEWIAREKTIVLDSQIGHNIAKAAHHSKKKM